MTISKNPVSGAIVITDIIDNQLVTRVYMGYTKREAVRRFRSDRLIVREHDIYTRTQYLNK
jgi:hypothetical protein